MSVERVGGEHYPTCDCCGSELQACPTYMGAIIAMRVDGWQRRRGPYDRDIEGYYYEDICPDCLELENG